MSSMASEILEKPLDGMSKSNSSFSRGKPLAVGAISAESAPNTTESGCISTLLDISLMRALLATSEPAE